MKKVTAKQFDLLNQATPKTRKEFFQNNFVAWWLFYYRRNFVYPLSDFHYEWLETLVNTELHILIEAFRWALKSEMVRAYIVWCICYNKHKFIVWQSYENKSSEESVRNIAKMLLNPLLTIDFWGLFPLSSPKDDLSKKSVTNFNSTNWVKVVSRSMWEKLRGAWTYEYETGSARPDLLILDDIDVTDSVANIDVIDKNYRKITWETIWALSKDKARIIFLWNTINADWIVPRFTKEKKESEFWKIFRQPLLDVEWKSTWGFITDLKIKEFKEEWEISFNQNYLLIPYLVWDAIIKRHQIKYAEYLPDFKSIVIAVDPAISEKTKSDSFAIVVTWTVWNSYYILEAIELKGTDKDPFKATQIVKNLYIKYNANKVIIETTAFQAVMAKLFKAEWIATQEIKPHRDKVTRLMEKQSLFEQWRVFFNTTWTQALVNQLLEFPAVKHDDLVDAMVYSFSDKKKKIVMARL